MKKKNLLQRATVDARQILIHVYSLKCRDWQVTELCIKIYKARNKKCVFKYLQLKKSEYSRVSRRKHPEDNSAFKLKKIILKDFWTNLPVPRPFMLPRDVWKGASEVHGWRRRRRRPHAHWSSPTSMAPHVWVRSHPSHSSAKERNKVGLIYTHLLIW